MLSYIHTLYAESFQVNEDMLWAFLEVEPCTLFQAPVATVQGLFAFLIL